MKRLLLAVALVLAMAIPAFAQNGPLKIKQLMVYTEDGLGNPTAFFNVGEEIYLGTVIEFKGSGSCTHVITMVDSAGDLIYKSKTTPVFDSPIFQGLYEVVGLGAGVPGVAGYYTIKSVIKNVKTGKTWTQQTKVHVSAQPS